MKFYCYYNKNKEIEVLSEDEIVILYHDEWTLNMTKELRKTGGELILDMISELTTLRNSVMMKQVRIDTLEERLKNNT